ncbi:hypothetical protein DBR11_16035 [Pedobacter sp. HMWF019]|uniref:hypothetical protein n=1 Tax=Pedobacter sp. HMWF019 TaxID=2056856 RepID=UPI000D3A5A87|nr:hypothetical protein [Pedobacter sp. HMWF019]PTS98019.1 hypothetical protein DBR11_16035 [Pedobacter sp. HMWF019]
MKTKSIYVLACVLALTCFFSCKKSSYLTDGGLSDPKSYLSTYDYLKQHKYHLFDTLIMVIDHYNLKEEVNGAATFFAPTNYSINKYLKVKKDSILQEDENGKYTLDDMYKDITADSLRIYMLKSRVELMTTPEQAAMVNNAANTKTAIQRILQPKASGAWSSAPIYYLYYIRVRGTLDPQGSTLPADDPTSDVKAQCQTTGIEPSTGGMLHVLNNQHTFIRF